MHLYGDLADMLARASRRLALSVVVVGIVVGALNSDHFPARQDLVFLAFLSAFVVGLAQQTIP